jgi:hypothetical protein
VLAKPSVVRVTQLRDSHALRRGDLGDDGFLKRGEQDDGEGGEVFERVGEWSRRGPGGLVVLEKALAESQRIRKATRVSFSCKSRGLNYAEGWDGYEIRWTYQTMDRVIQFDKPV